MRKVLTHANIEKNVQKATIGVWTDKTGFEWELCFDDDGDFLGVCIDELTEDQLTKLQEDCINNEGFYSPSFDDTDINLYDITYSIA